MTVLEGSGARVDITPRPGCALAGFVQRGNRPSTGVHDPLEANVLYLRGGSSELAWVSIDVLSVDQEIRARVASSVSAGVGCDPDRVIVCATHTHAAPAGWIHDELGLLSADTDRGMRSRLVEQVAEACARMDPRPVSVTLSTIPGPRVGTNRNTPAGPADPTTGLVAVRDARGHLIGAAFNHACHPTVLRASNLALSADWPGAARGALRERTAPQLPVVFLQGAAGDVSTRFTRQGAGPGEMERLGRRLGDAMARDLVSGGGTTVVGSPRLARFTVPLPTKPVPAPEDARAIRVASERAFQDLDPGADPAARRIAQTRMEGAWLLERMAALEMPAKIDLSCSAVAMDDHAWVHLPVEPFASIGRAIDESSGFSSTRVVGYAGGYWGYLADEAAHRRGVYEALTSPFPPEASALTVAEAVVALATLEEVG